MKTSKRAVFLDRDGVLNKPVVREGLPYPPQTVAEFELYPDTVEACRKLRAAGFLLVVVTNQPDVGRGTQTLEEVEAMHAVLRQAIPLDRIEVCTAPDTTGPEAYRRKPAPGMVRDAAKALGIDLGGSYLVGDRWRDVDCGRAAGCWTVFIDRGYHEPLRQLPDARCGSLAEAADLILKREAERPAAANPAEEAGGKV